MARKVAAIIFAMAIIMGSALPALAQQKSTKPAEKPLWEIIADSFKDFKVREQDKIRTSKDFPLFQNMSDSLKEGSQKAKDLSLRGK